MTSQFTRKSRNHKSPETEYCQKFSWRQWAREVKVIRWHSSKVFCIYISFPSRPVPPHFMEALCVRGEKSCKTIYLSSRKHWFALIQSCRFTGDSRPYDPLIWVTGDIREKVNRGISIVLGNLRRKDILLWQVTLSRLPSLASYGGSNVKENNWFPGMTFIFFKKKWDNVVV